MKNTFIKWLDLYIGKGICFFLSIHASLFKKKDLPNDGGVVFLKLIEQGATILAIPALEEAITKYGKQNVYFAVFKENRAVLDTLSIIEKENIFEFRTTSLSSFLIDAFKFRVFCKKQKITASVDMEFFSRSSAILSYWSGACKRVGLHAFGSEQPYRGDLMTHRINYNPYLHVSEYYLLLVKVLQLEEFKGPEIPFSKKDLKISLQSTKPDLSALESVKKKLKGAGDLKKLLILNPNASDMLPLRKWDSAKFIELANRILAFDSEIHIVFTGVEKEREAIETFSKSLPPSSFTNLAGRTNLNELFALYSLSKVLVTNDSGPAHFASVCDTQVVVLFGPETPELFGPLGEHVHIIYKKLACSPCVNVYNHRFSPCQNNLCMQNITVNEVFDKVKSLL